ncbi:MAG: ATP-binding protein [Acidobacteriota bacterium]
MLSPLTLRLLAFNLLLVFLPVAGFLSLDTYERQLLDSQERAMVQQARLMAAALSGRGSLDAAEADRLLIELNRRLQARLRVIDAAGLVIADSSRLGPRRDLSPTSAKASRTGGEPQDRLYELATDVYRFYRRLRPRPDLPGAQAGLYWNADANAPLRGPAVQEALAGRYGADLRVIPGRGVDERAVTMLHSAIPIVDQGEVVGAVLVSQSTARILRSLGAVRLNIFRVFLASLVAAVVLSLLVATTIARPLVRLRDEARDLVDRRGRLKGRFQGSEKADEIGDLARALEELTRRLEERARLTESFAADLSHEFKNPLASIRTAAEMLGDVEQPADRERFQQVILKQGKRLEHLLSAVREISGIDAGLEQGEVVDFRLDELLQAVADGYRLRGSAIELGDIPALTITAVPERIAQVVENLLDNALSFSPPDQPVRLTLEADGHQALMTVRDHGPGIPPEHIDRIFDRFFSYRQDDQKNGHSGLGLAITRAIVEGRGGNIQASNHPQGGAQVQVRLPLAEG